MLYNMDSKLLDSESEEAKIEGQSIKYVLQNIMNIGVACSNAIPQERMATNAVINELQEARDTLLNIQPNI